MIIAAAGERGLFLLLAMFSAAGLGLTLILLPEPKLKSLEESSMRKLI